MKNIVLTGFAGTGKTSTGRLLAARLGLAFVDVDRKIERENGLPIAEIFARYGEDFFRRRERETIARVARWKNAVIATGGGVVLHPQNMERLRANGVIICLTSSVSTIVERTGRRTTRPLLNGPDREGIVKRLLAERASQYAEADFSVDTSDISLQQAVEQIIAFLRQGGYLDDRG